MSALVALLLLATGLASCERWGDELIARAAAASRADGASPVASGSAADARPDAHPDDGAPPCPRTGARARLSSPRGPKGLGQVRVGWTVNRLLKLMGDPRSCDGSKWFYQYGNPDGPLETYTFTIARGRVASISRAGAACIYRVDQE